LRTSFGVSLEILGFRKDKTKKAPKGKSESPWSHGRGTFRKFLRMTSSRRLGFSLIGQPETGGILWPQNTLLGMGSQGENSRSISVVFAAYRL